jgi:hypothetical protein
MQMLVTLLALGLPLALFFAWASELTLSDVSITTLMNC